MPRIARVVIPGYPHHVTQRGVRGMDIFRSDSDRRAYLEILAEAGGKHGLGFWAWCLMSNHVHLLAVPERPGSLAGAIREAHWRYTRLVNFREGVRGHLFQERFHSCPVQKDRQLVAAARYVELNPVRAGLVRRAEDWPWSSAAFNAGRRPEDPLLEASVVAGMFGSWRRVLRDGEEEAERRRTELHISKGWPLGEERWVRRLELESGQRLRAGQPGWPKGKPREPRKQGR
jgi:putative transposase